MEAALNASLSASRSIVAPSPHSIDGKSHKPKSRCKPSIGNCAAAPQKRVLNIIAKLLYKLPLR